MLQIEVQITTPKGKATKVAPYLKSWLLPFGTKADTNIIDDRIIYWKLKDLSAKQFYKINRNVSTYDVIMKNIFESKRLKKMLPKLLNKDDLQELKEMLQDQTKVEIIRGG